MANWPQFAGWPPPPSQNQQSPPPLPYGINAADFRPGTPFLQHSPRMSSPGFHQFGPPSGPPPGPPPNPSGHAVCMNVYPPSGISPGFNNNFSGWNPYARGYPATAPNVLHSQSQDFPPGLGYTAPGNYVSVTPPSQSHGPDQQSGQAQQGLHDSRRVSGGDSVDRGSNPVVPKSSDLYKLVDRVEDTIGKILALTKLQTSKTEWSVCPYNRHHVVPVEALLRHKLQCPSSFEGTVEASSLLHSLQYPRTVDLDRTKPSAHDDRISDRPPGAVSSSNHATLSFEDVALISVNYTPIRQLELETLKQEPGYEETDDLSEIPRVPSNPECRTLTLSTSRQQFDPRGSLFFYREAPGVVLTSFAHGSSKGFGDPMFSMPSSLRVEMEKCPHVTLKRFRNKEIENLCSASSPKTIGFAEEKYEESCGAVKESSSVRLLPSMLWSLRKELDSWKDMPSLCSRTVIEAATCLGRVRKALIVEWLLVHSPVYGVVLDVAMAAHIACLVQLYLRALRTQSLMLLEQKIAKGLNKNDTSTSSNTVVVECPMYTEASAWLASWLSHLYGPISSKTVVLDILKHCLNSCGRLLSIVPLALPSQLKTNGKSAAFRAESDREFKVLMEQSEMLLKETDNACIDVSSVMASEEIPEVKQVGAAMDALYERANFERYIKSGLSINNVTRTQRIVNYDMTVNFASNERANRPNYRAVCEHDGLTWQRSQQEEKRNKTKAEILAEERDYKRRRMSYRGKKLKRTPLQVLRDIIENHMAEITEAGGIGCFSKQPVHIPSTSHTDLEIQQQLQGRIPANPNFQYHSGSAHHSGNVSAVYDEHRETSSSVRDESRSRSQSRNNDQRHRDSRR